MINLVLQLFACFTVYGIEYTDTLVGPAYIAEIPITYTQEEQDFCLKNLSKWGSSIGDRGMDTYQCSNYVFIKSIATVIDRIIPDEAAKLDQLKPRNDLIFLPSVSTGKNQTTGCRWTEQPSLSEQGWQIGFWIQVRCPSEPVSKLKAIQTVKDFFINRPPRSLTVVLPKPASPVAGAEEAVLENISVPLNLNECLSSLQGDEVTRTYTCDLHSGPELAEVDAHPGHKFSLYRQVWIAKTGKRDHLDIRLAYDESSQKHVVRAKLLPVWRGPFQATASEELKKVIEAAFSELRTYNVQMIFGASATAAFSTSRLNFFERAVKVDINTCFTDAARAGAAPQACAISGVAKAADSTLISFPSAVTQELKVEEGKSTHVVTGKAESGKLWEAESSDSFGRQISYTIEVKEVSKAPKTAVPEAPKPVLPMLKAFEQVYPELKYIIAK